MRTLSYGGVEFRTRTFDVEAMDGSFTGSYLVADEALEDAMGEDVDEDICCLVYHYVPNEVLDLSAEEIVSKHLDMPFKLIQEVIYE